MRVSRFLFAEAAKSKKGGAGKKSVQVVVETKTPKPAQASKRWAISRWNPDHWKLPPWNLYHCIRCLDPANPHRIPVISPLNDGAQASPQKDGAEAKPQTEGAEATQKDGAEATQKDGAQANPQDGTPAAEGARKKKKKQNGPEIGPPKTDGVGLMFYQYKWQWTEPCYWTITKHVTKRKKIWGIFTWRGRTEPKARMIRQAKRRDWWFLPSLDQWDRQSHIKRLTYPEEAREDSNRKAAERKAKKEAEAKLPPPVWDPNRKTRRTGMRGKKKGAAAPAKPAAKKVEKKDK